MERLRDWFANLNARERTLVQAAAALLVLALAWLVIVLPLQASGTKLEARVERKSADLEWMRRHVPEVMAASGIPAQGSGESLVVIVDRTARQAGLGPALRDQSPSGEASLRLRLEGASFDIVAAWLVSLQQRYGITVETATIDAAAPGLVNATLSLTQGGAAG